MDGLVSCKIIASFYGRDRKLYHKRDEPYLATEEEFKKLEAANCLRKIIDRGDSKAGNPADRATLPPRRGRPRKLETKEEARASDQVSGSLASSPVAKPNRTLPGEDALSSKGE